MLIGLRQLVMCIGWPAQLLAVPKELTTDAQPVGIVLQPSVGGHGPPMCARSSIALRSLHEEASVEASCGCTCHLN